MPKFTVERAHQLSLEEAKRRLQALADRLAAKYGLSANWRTPTEADVKGTGATGKITCGADRVSVMIDLSFALTPLKGKIEDRVRRELDTALTAPT